MATKHYRALVNLPGVSAGRVFDADPANEQVKRYLAAGMLEEEADAEKPKAPTKKTDET